MSDSDSGSTPQDGSFPKASFSPPTASCLSPQREEATGQWACWLEQLQPTLKNASEVFTAFFCSPFLSSISLGLVGTFQGFGYHLAPCPDQCGLTGCLDWLNHFLTDVIFLEDIACWIRKAEWVAVALN